MDGLLLAVSGTAPDNVVPLARSLAARLSQAVGVSEAGDLVRGIRSLAAQGVRRIVVLPLPLSLHQEDITPPIVRLASRRWPFLAFHQGTPPGWLEWADIVRGAVAEVDEIGLRYTVPNSGPGPSVITAPATGDRLADANLARLAWLTGTAACFEGEVPPGQIAVPCFSPDREALVDCLLAHREAALNDDALTRPAWSEVAARVTASPQDEAAALADLDRRIDALLPPAYQGRWRDVSPTSMGSAALIVDERGAVAWDRMWTSFCDLALAGGPSHRGTLLEAVTSEEAHAQPARYGEVVAEIERGIRLVAGRPTVASRVAGWVGMRCDSEEMAVWLLRAIIVENVMVRREGDVVYLPAGPSFRLEREIKNVVTVVAKTCHYWSSHRRADLTT